MRVGSEGGIPGQIVYSVGANTAPTEMLTVAGQQVFASLVAQTEVSLPDDATDQVLFVLAPFTTTASQAGGR